MVVHVAVVDPLPMYRQGVASVLSAAGHAVDTPADVLAWVRHGPHRVVLLTLESEQDWDLLRRLRDADGTHAVIALVGEDSAVLGVRAVRTGARSVLPRGVTPGTLRRTVEATLDGQAVLPADVAAALASGAHSTGEGAAAPEPQQLSWLRQLADGVTVAQLARRAGYSERAMFRLLQELYRDMGVRTRIQAIVRAQEEGWLRAGPEPLTREVARPRGSR
ncbi:two component transcriptional regulator, LuxR family [[Actinomadura] parvosata subsp. kistnae]|uniref:Response regulator receiver protein n=1 Tax=[Actinomadura] parvosata subsp. kistnae TaxID=1909395 RepID=A0A1U9ZZB6_9ACTN|nr:response regulator transcription factor [Nonomuraea sp. ATCC 55076]AQZ63306.1 response regulator receiver protein [Nonomuraea sp. ATCC 55076]SPL98999.1 two component transcriptional regulator, LuxR family [Actinomadura parvosata subsp. kistnae]